MLVAFCKVNIVTVVAEMIALMLVLLVCVVDNGAVGGVKAPV
jgi:hypothetical protein